MPDRFKSYRNTDLGHAIEAIARQEHRPFEFALLSKLGMPAVVALSWDVKPLLLNLSESERREAKQYCGVVVGEIMRELGYEIVNPRGSAQAGGVFTFGAVWAPFDDARTAKIANEIMSNYRETLRALADS